MLDFEIPYRSVAEQIISVTHLPPWMLGMHWATTERLSEMQADGLERIISDMQEEDEKSALWAADWWALVHGYSNVDRHAEWPNAGNS